MSGSGECTRWVDAGRWLCALAVAVTLAGCGKTQQAEPDDQASVAASEAAVEESDAVSVDGDDSETVDATESSAAELSQELDTHVACVYAGERMQMIADGPAMGFDEETLDAARQGKDVVARHTALAKAMAETINARADQEEIVTAAYARTNKFEEAMASDDNATVAATIATFAGMMGDECL
ncbi:MAG: hypothetical protein ACR2I8_10240 [Steroidobacteraceae bacterium]